MFHFRGDSFFVIILFFGIASFYFNKFTKNKRTPYVTLIFPNLPKLYPPSSVTFTLSLIPSYVAIKPSVKSTSTPVDTIKSVAFTNLICLVSYLISGCFKTSVSFSLQAIKLPPKKQTQNN